MLGGWIGSYFVCMIENIRGFITKVVDWYSGENRWWVPLFAGLTYTLSFSPFDGETHFILFLFPFFGFINIVPLFLFACLDDKKKAYLHVYLYGITASLTQFYWISFVQIEGLFWVLILALFSLSLVVSFVFLLYGVLFRFARKKFGSWYFLVFTSFWVFFEYFRTLSDLSLPWTFSGYALTSLLPIAQLASICGVYGLSFIVIIGNCLVFELLQSFRSNENLKKSFYRTIVFITFLLLVSAWGMHRIQRYGDCKRNLRVSLIQNNIDQSNWKGRVSLDTAMAVTEKMVEEAVGQEPDLILFPESGIYCYLERQRRRKIQVLRWSLAFEIPMILGTLHFEQEKENPYYNYKVFNAVFYLAPAQDTFDRYFKIKLLPFSEALPFEGYFPILSRVNLGESDFHRGNEAVVFNIQDSIHAAPFLCYEIIFPKFVRKRVNAGANLLVNLTNDGWFGKSTGSYQHASLARMRTIENGVPLARCANSGISMLVDPIGKIITKTNLCERLVITDNLPFYTIKTFYSKFGDWVIWLSILILLNAAGFIIFKGIEKK